MVKSRRKYIIFDYRNIHIIRLHCCTGARCGLVLQMSVSVWWSQPSMSCAEMAELIKMSFWLWTSVGPRYHLLVGGPDPPPTGTDTLVVVIVGHAETCPQSIFSVLFTRWQQWCSQTTIAACCWCCSEAEASVHVPFSPVPRLWAALLQPVRPAAQHQLPWRLTEPDVQVCAAAVHRVAVPCRTRPQRHPLRPQAREHPAVQPQTLGDQDSRLRQLVSARQTRQ